MVDFDRRHKSQTLNAGQNLSLGISYSGFPAPKTEWFFNDQPISPSPRATIDTSDLHSSLKVAGLNADDEGVYKVKITNLAGSEVVTFDTRIKGKVCWNFYNISVCNG